MESIDLLAVFTVVLLAVNFLGLVIVVAIVQLGHHKLKLGVGLAIAIDIAWVWLVWKRGLEFSYIANVPTPVFFGFFIGFFLIWVIILVFALAAGADSRGRTT